MRLLKSIIFKGDLFATGLSFGGLLLIKLISSIVLTRILRPEAYGVITIITSIAFVVTMLADTNVSLFLIRDKNAEDPRYINTAWTMRLCRSFLNTTIVFLGAPFITTTIYHAPELVTPLRVYSICDAISGLGSMAFVLAVRRKQSRITMYSELTAVFISTAFSVIYCYFSRNYWGIIYGMVFNSLLMMSFSYRFYPEFRPKFQFDKTAAREILSFTKFTMPSSLLTIALTQFDKAIFLRLFDLRLLGIYGLAGNIANPVEALVGKISSQVLYPRCAHNFRTDESSYAIKYYTENVKLFASIMIVPAAVGGAAHLLIALLYDPRYAQAAAVLQAFMVRAMLLSLSTPAEDLLVASGSTHVILVGNLCRAAGMFLGCFIGYQLFGFTGFTYGVALSALLPLLYNWWYQHSKHLLIVRYELVKVSFIVSVLLGSAATSWLISTFWAVGRISIRH